MKIFTVCILLLIGCHRGGELAQSLPGTESTGSAVAAPTPVVTSTAAGSSVTTGAPDSVAQTPAPTSELAKAVDEFNKRLASIWALPTKQRFSALCPIAEDLAARAEALGKMQSTSPNWEAAVGELSMALSDTQSACADQAKETGHLNPDQQEVVDYGKAQHVTDVHDDFVATAKLVPGARAVK